MLNKIFKVESGLRGRLDKFLAGRGLALSRAAIQRTISSGGVRVNGRTVTERDFSVSSGDAVQFSYRPPVLAPAPQLKLTKVYEDRDVLVINKPAGLVVHPNPGQEKVSVAGALAAQIDGIRSVGSAFRPGIVHRLDADTSGLLVVAKTPAAYEYLKGLFQSRQILKEYSALVHGRFAEGRGTFNAPIGRRAGEGRFRAGFGRPAETEYRVEALYDREIGPVRKSGGSSSKPNVSGKPSKGEPSDGVDNYSLLKVQLHTGRTHQIRVHCASVGHPVAGDRLYGGKFKAADAKIFPRQFLHACALEFTLPGGQRRRFSAPLPDDLQRILKTFKKS